MQYSQLHSFVPRLKEICIGAGEVIMAVKRSNQLGIKLKSDNSLLTLADISAHEYIIGCLCSSWPDLSVISEEDNSSLVNRKDLKNFWLIDPLDGTKEFLEGNDEFTVNIALILNSRPALGLVYAPALDLLYWGGLGMGSYVTSNGVEETIHVDLSDSYNHIRVEVSKSHLNEETLGFVERLGATKLSFTGSSLKFCRIAEGEADVYPRLAPTSEWDTAAAHAVLEGAGGVVVDVSGKPIRYGKSSIINPSFIATSSLKIVQKLLNS